MRRRVPTVARTGIALLMIVLAVPSSLAQVNMPDPKQISGVPLPAPELAAGTVSVRVIRGTFANNLPNQPVEVTVDGRTQSLRTGDDGRVQISDVKPGARVQAFDAFKTLTLEIAASIFVGVDLGREAQRMNDAFQAMVAYWSRRARRPSAELVVTAAVSRSGSGAGKSAPERTAQGESSSRRRASTRRATSARGKGWSIANLRAPLEYA